MSITLSDVAHVLAALIRCALADVRTGDREQRAEAEMFLSLVQPEWRTRSNQLQRLAARQA